MKEDKWLYFRNVTDADDDDGLLGTNKNHPTSLMIPASRLACMQPMSDTTLSLEFSPIKHLEVGSQYQRTKAPKADAVILTVTQGKTFEVMEAITHAINSPSRTGGFIVIADDVTTFKDNSTRAVGEYIHKDISGVDSMYAYRTPQGFGMHEYWEMVSLSATAGDADGKSVGQLLVSLPAQAILLEGAMTVITRSDHADSSVRLDIHSASRADGATGGTEWIGAGSSGTASIPNADLNNGSGDVLYDTLHSGTHAPIDRDTAETFIQVTACEDTSGATTSAGIIGVYIKWFGSPAEVI